MAFELFTKDLILVFKENPCTLVLYSPHGHKSKVSFSNDDLEKDTLPLEYCKWIVLSILSTV